LGGAAVGIASLPVLLPTAPGNLTPADLGLLVAMGTTLLWAGTNRQRLRLPFAVGVATIAVAGTLAALAGDAPGVGVVAVVQDLYLLAWAAALANLGRSVRAMSSLVTAWCGTAGAWAVGLVVFSGYSLAASAEPARAGFTFGDQNGAGLYFVLSAFVVLAARRPRRLLWRGVTMTALLLGALFTGSLGAMSGLLAGLAAALVLAVHSRRGPAPAMAFSLALLLVVGSAVLLAVRHDVVEAAHQSSYVLVRNSIGRGAQSSSEREALAKETYGLWRSSGLLGGGPASTVITLREQQAPYPKEAHNDWVAALVERGVLGFAGLLLLVAEIAFLAARVSGRTRLAPGFDKAVPAPAYLVGGLVCVLVFSVTHEVLHDRTVWTLFALVAASALWGRPARRPQSGGKS